MKQNIFREPFHKIGEMFVADLQAIQKKTPHKEEIQRVLKCLL